VRFDFVERGEVGEKNGAGEEAETAAKVPFAYGWPSAASGARDVGENKSV
jgi:hypothetical protein